MKWLKTKDKVPSDGAEILISVEGVNHVAEYDASQGFFYIGNQFEKITFKTDLENLYWMEFDKSPFNVKPLGKFHFLSKKLESDELVAAYSALAIQNQEKEIRELQLISANEELAFQNNEKGKRAAELVIANQELAYQNKEKGDRADELVIANKELAFQNEEKGKRASELIIANKELIFQNTEKENRAAELSIANKELAFQNEEKEKRAVELLIANKELLAFTYISSHDLQEPLRKIQMFAGRILDVEYRNLSEKGKDYFVRMQSSAGRMQQLLIDLLGYSRISHTDGMFEETDLNLIIDEVRTELKEIIDEKRAKIEVRIEHPAIIIPFQFRQLIFNLVSNALKFSIPETPPLITINSAIAKGRELSHKNLFPEKEYYHLTTVDNGIGFEPQFSEQIFEVFQQLHAKEKYIGTGIGLAIVKKIVENHKGVITATGELMKGAKFDIYIPSR